MTMPISDRHADEQLREARRLADVAHARLVEIGATVAVAESLTGGLVSAFLTAAPNTSVTFRGGLVVYAADAKHDVAGVDRAALDEHGPVHETVATQLAIGARTRLGADYGIGVTGVAGPGEQNGHPVGEVYVAVASGDDVEWWRHELPGNRDGIRLGAVAAALGRLVAMIEKERR
jgi:nicotinamide-nucleotide amidase